MTRGSPIPVVYVETNWLVACVVTHDDHHPAAVRLLEQAENGECDLRIPLAAVLESKHTVENTWTRPFKQLESFRNAITKAYRNGAASLNRIESGLDAVLKDSGVRTYVEREVETERQALLKNRAVSQFSAPEAEAAMMEALHPVVRLAGVDVLDFYIISAVVADRQRTAVATRPALFFSLNPRDLIPGKKLSPDFYAQRRIVFRSDFQLIGGLKDWSAAFPT